MLSRIMFNIAKRTICNNAYILHYACNSLQSNLICNNSVKQHSVQNHYCLYVAKRLKSTKKKTSDNRKHIDEDSDEDKSDDEEKAPVGSKVVTVYTQSIRLDVISKAGFGITRNKIEEAFYGSKIRVNGRKVFKKSMELDVGDEIDVILHRDVNNPALLVVNRLVILSMNVSTNDSIQIKLSKDKNLLIEDYEEPWSSESS